MATDKKTPGKIITELVDSEFRITIDNQARLNAMSLGMWQDLERAVAAAHEEPGAKIIVLSGAGGKSFVSGADISEFGERRDSQGQRALFDKAVGGARDAITTSALPTVALIQGICMGGGMALALACDLRYCTNRTRFRMPAARLGLGYDVKGVRRFIDIVGAAATTELFLTARTFDGVEAARMGLVHEAYDDERFTVLARERVETVKSRAPLTQKAAKLAILSVLEGDEASEQQAVRAVEACFTSSDYVEGQKAFLEKRKPQFAGK